MHVTFMAGRDGSPMTRFDGKVAFPQRGGTQPHVGETWAVEKAGENPSGKVVFLRLLERIPSEREMREIEEAEGKKRKEERAQMWREYYQKHGVLVSIIIGTNSTLCIDTASDAQIFSGNYPPGIYRGLMDMHDRSVLIVDCIGTEKEGMRLSKDVHKRQSARNSAEFRADETAQRAQWFGLLKIEWYDRIKSIALSFISATPYADGTDWGISFSKIVDGLSFASAEEILAECERRLNAELKIRIILAKLAEMKGKTISGDIPLIQRQYWNAMSFQGWGPADGEYEVEGILIKINGGRATVHGRQYYIELYEVSQEKMILHLYSTSASGGETHFAESADGYLPAGTVMLPVEYHSHTLFRIEVSRPAALVKFDSVYSVNESV